MDGFWKYLLFKWKSDILLIKGFFIFFSIFLYKEFKRLYILRFCNSFLFFFCSSVFIKWIEDLRLEFSQNSWVPNEAATIHSGGADVLKSLIVNQIKKSQLSSMYEMFRALLNSHYWEIKWGGLGDLFVSIKERRGNVTEKRKKCFIKISFDLICENKERTITFKTQSLAITDVAKQLS